MRGVQKCTRACASLRSKKSIQLCCIILVTATDPCCGSGHILAYMFDVLMKIYESYGYTTREAVASIVENNIYGLDIDDRAAQLAYFAVMIKARQYDRRFFSRGIQPHVYAIVESNHVDKFAVEYFCNGDTKLKAAMDTIISELHDAKEYGSILTVTPQDWSALYDRFAEITEDIHISRDVALVELLPLVQVAEALTQKYDVVVTNPPYMGGSGMSGKLAEYVKQHYPNSKSDISTVCMEKTLSMCLKHGFMAMINIPVWMFISSYEKLRKNILESDTFINMVHLGRGVFGSDFGTTAFVISRDIRNQYKGFYRRLFEKTGAVDTVETKESWFFSGMGKFSMKQESYFYIPSTPIAYWASDAVLDIFKNSNKMGNYAEGRKGLVTGNDDLYLKLWHEVSTDNFSVFSGFEKTKWKPCNKGGNYRKWYGNNDYIVNWGQDGTNLANHRWPDGRQRSSLRNSSYFLEKL